MEVAVMQKAGSAETLTACMIRWESLLSYGGAAHRNGTGRHPYRPRVACCDKKPMAYPAEFYFIRLVSSRWGMPSICGLGGCSNLVG